MLVGSPSGAGVAFGKRLGPAALLAADDVDRPAVHQRQQPRGGGSSRRIEARGRSPGGQEGILDGVLCQLCVANDPQRDGVRDPAEAVVQRGEGVVVAARDEREQRLVRS
jgi:hypothetical protein